MTTENSATYQFIIAGAGSSGCVLANRLSADPKCRVLLIEAGPSDWNPMVHIPLTLSHLLGGRLMDWGYSTEPEPEADNRRISESRGKVIGGSSSVNGMIYVRGHAEDYNDWARMGAAGWSYADVKPYFIRAENYPATASQERGSLGPLQIVNNRYENPLFDAFIAAGRDLGYKFNADYNTGDHEGFSWVQFTQDHRKARRCSSAVAYLKPARQRPNLTVVTGAHVTGLTFSGHRCTGLSYSRKGHVQSASAAETILSAGVYGSAQILLLSGIGPADELRALGIKSVLDLKGVGRNLQDHCGAGIQFLCTKPLTFHALRKPWTAAVAAWQLFAQNKGPFSVFPMSAHAFVRSSSQEPRPDLQIQFFPVSNDGKGGYATMSGYAITAGVMRPRSRGSVTLRSASPFAAPVIRHNFLSNPHDRDVLIAGLRLAREINAQRPFAEFTGPEHRPGPDCKSDADFLSYIRATVASQYHPSGSCRMGADENAVVGPDLRVHGIDGLRVADASIMPTVISGNTNGPCIMIGEKASDLVLTGAGTSVMH